MEVVVNKKSRRTESKARPRADLDNFDPLDRGRAASLADEGGASAAATEKQERPSPNRSMLFELSIMPLGEVHMSDELAQILETIDRSGLPYQLTPGSTVIEGSWEEVLPVIRACHAAARRSSRHVITSLRIEDDEGQANKIRSNVESVQAKATRELETSL
jgi:uncharacterized protein (TIGR00106 family)